MKKNTSTFLTVFLGFLLVFLFWKLSFIFAYIFISLIFSIILSPINKKLISYRINKTISSLLCLLIIFFVVISFGFLLYPLIYEEIKIINSNLNTNSFTNFINQFIYNTNEYLLSYGIDSQIKSDDIISLLPITSFTTLFDSIFSILGNMFLASFSILFMTFFMLRDSSIIKEKIHNILSNYLTNVDEKMDSIVFYLKRYFSGLGLQLLILFSCYAIGLKIFNIEYALAIAFFAAIINIIPYVGPIIGFSFAAIIISSHTGIDLLPGILLKTFILFSIIQTADNFIFQPLIFAKSLQVHPLEIFIIVLSAGMLGGILWMLLAIPSYALIKICLSGIFSNSKDSLK